jgi:hypothetical protein
MRTQFDRPRFAQQNESEPSEATLRRSPQATNPQIFAS